MTPFRLLETPLDDGTSLIEASAGTGKTHTIAGVFLRLLVESALAGRAILVDEILVVTYTDAATEELRDRIRTLLALAAAGFSEGRSANEFIRALIAQHAAHRESLRDQLVLALNCFDLAPIFTIHGFCQRALKDRAFESGALFDAEVLPDQSALLREIADDFWRRNFYAATPLRVAIALRHGLGPENFLRLLRGCLSHPELKFLTRAGNQPAEALAAELEAAFSTAQVLWRQERAVVEKIFADASNWANKPYNDGAKVAAAIADVETLLRGDGPETSRLGVLEFFAASALAEKTKKPRNQPRLPAPRHEFFDFCDRFVRLQADYVTALRRDFVGFARAELHARKEKLKLLSYDDLLTRLRDALRAPGGASLAAQLRRKYRVALIDEFQDTDPVQCEIFQRIFANVDETPSLTPLFLIGDPKQAIYGFRGADIFTYMGAAERTQQKFTLGENWRSESGLVRAVNTLFSAGPEPFVFDRIQFHPVEARGEANKHPLEIDGRREPPLQIWFCRRDEKPISKGRAEHDLARSTAAEITRLLNGNVTIGGRPLRPQDIAVLTMTHKQAAQVQEALRALRVPSVQQTQASVFASVEAAQLLRLLAGIAAPWNEPFVRAALATDLLGVSGTDLGAMDSAAWSLRLAKFREWFELWVGRGFTAMFRQVLDGERVRGRLLALPEGERALTNVLHLAEVLHEAALREKLGAGGLIQWLATRLEEETAAEEHQLRLERDENAVQLVTVHKSKGLQYEIAFVPFCWRGSELKQRNASEDEQEVLFHDEQTGRLVRDLGPGQSAENIRLAKRERLAESVRLLYVALTRAKHRCYFAWGAFSGAESSAPAWLLHRGAPGSRPAVEEEAQVEQDLVVPQAQWPLSFTELSDERMMSDLEALAGQSNDTKHGPAIAVGQAPADPGDVFQPKSIAVEVLACREFKGHVPRDWRVASFSGLASGQRDEAPDRDAALAPPVPKQAPVSAEGIFAFPRGSKAGTCLHSIFEEFDFTEAGSPALEGLTQQKLREHGFQSDPAGSVAAAVRNTLAAPLDPSHPALKLSAVPVAERLNELEFCFPLRRLAVADLVDVFARHGRPKVQGDFPEQLGRLTFSPLRGFIKGFIDLVFRADGKFWLVDWKSNHLGNRAEDYGAEALRREMNERYYLLQYHLYVAALDRWLELRVKDYDYARDFGGVFYLFLRGIDPARPDLGIFRDRPEPELVKALGAVLFAPTPT